MKKLVILLAALMPLNALAQICNDAIARTAFQARFEISLGDPSVALDTVTGLTWQRCSFGLDFNDQDSPNVTDDSCDQPIENTDNSSETFVQTTFTWNDALNAVDAEGAPWRLPNFKELSSLVEYACSSPSIDVVIFPDSTASEYWSNTPNADDDFEAWAVNFSDGSDSSVSKASFFPIRFVQD